MPAQPADPYPSLVKVPDELLNLTVWPPQDAEFRLIGDDAALPDHFWAHIVPRATLPDVRLEVRIIDGQPACVGLELWATTGRRDGAIRPAEPGEIEAPVTAAVLRRIPLGRWLTEATAHAVMPFTREPNGSLGPYMIDGQPAWAAYADPRASDQRAVLDLLADKSSGARRGIPLDGDDLREVTRVYRTALDLGQPPTMAVARAMHVSRPTASRWIARARREGFLGPALRGRGGG